MASSDWANLPKLLLYLVLERLSSPWDFVRFSNVCLSWNSVAKDNMSKRTTPLLLIHSDKETWDLCDIKEDRVIEQLELPYIRFCGFSKGWLVMIDENFIVSLLHPFSRLKGRKNENSIIRLPALRRPKTRERRIWWLHAFRNYIFKATISADPIASAKDCVVVVIYDDGCQLGFTRLGKDANWTYIDAQCYMIEEVICTKDKFYAVDDKNKLFSFQVSAEFNSNDVILLAEDFNQDDSDNVIVNTKGFEQDSFIKRYLVELSGNELLMIQRFYRFVDRRRETLKFEIFKLDHDNCEWTKKHTLDDIALFIGDNTSISVLTSSNLGLPTNCIYFTHDWDRRWGAVELKNNGCDCGIYNIISRSFLPIDTTHVATLIKKISALLPIWTVANIKL